MNKIELYHGTENGAYGIGLHILSPHATVEDLLQAWQFLCDDTSIHKYYARDHHGSCKGCINNCCNTAYVIPDLIAFKQMAHNLGLNHEELIDRYFHRDKVKIGILRMQPDPCVFLRDNICTIYHYRALMCRLYICCSILGTTETLIYSIAWAGAAATQQFAREQGLLAGSSARGYSSFDRLFYRLMEEYRFSRQVELFLQAERYGDIPLEPFRVHPA